MSRSKKQPKRVRAWLATWPDDTDGGLRGSRSDAEFDNHLYGGGGRIARLVELRPGEVVVDVERLADFLARKDGAASASMVRAALRKVGVR